MRIKIATALVCLALCILTNTTDTTFAHSHQKVISDVTNNTNEMMIEEDSVKVSDTIKTKIETNTIQQQKSNQTYVVKRLTYYYPNGHKTATGHSAKGHEKIVALSPDLLKKIPYHSKIEIEGYGVFTVEDRTASRVKSTIDVLVSRGSKIKNGRNVVIKIIDKGK